MDDELTCKQIILNDKLNVSLNILHAKLKQQELEVRMQSNFYQGISEYLNVFSLQQTPTEVYLKKFARIHRII